MSTGSNSLKKALSLLSSVCLVSCTCGRQLGQGGEDVFIHEPNLQDYPDVQVSWEGPVCGNGILEDPEECDDGNRRNCDGCTANCLVEEEGICGDGGGADASTDGSVGDPPPPPEPQGGLVPVETPGGESPRITEDRFRVIWTGSYYSVMYTHWCPGMVCLGMTRFDAEGVILSPEWVYVPVEHDINAFDYCWNGHGFGLAWAERQSLYMVLLDWNGKLVRGPVRICDGCLPYFGLGIEGHPSIGCGPDGYLLSYNVEVGFLVSSRWLQKVSANLDLLDGAYLGHTDLDLVFTFSHGGSWRLIFVSETVETYPVSTYNLVLDAISDGLAYEWRSLIARFKPYEVDYDATEDEVLVVFREQDESYTLASLDPEDGSMLSTVSSLEGFYLKVASLGGGSAAIIRSGEALCPIHVEGSSCGVLSVIDPAGLESERVVVAAGMGGLGSDVVWTGSEIGVVLALPVSEGGCRYYLQRFSL